MRTAHRRVTLIAFLALAGGIGTGTAASAQVVPSDCALAVQVAAGDERYVCRLYTDLLQRQNVPTDPEIDFWVGQLRAAGRAAVTDALTRSDEHYRVVVRQAYLEMVKRPADSAGVAYWVGILRQDVPLELVEGVIVGSDEGFQAQAGGDNARFVDAIFRMHLGRPPAQEETDQQVALIASRGNGAAARTQMAIEIGTSAEARNRTAAELYVRWLARFPDPEGHVYWAQRLGTAGFLVAQSEIVSSDEAYGVLNR